MGTARIRLEGRLEEVEAAVATVKSVRASLRGGFPGLLERVPALVASLEEHLPHLRRHRESDEVATVLREVRVETTGLVTDGARLAKSLGLPEPRSPQEVCRVLASHLPLRLNERVIAKPVQLAFVLLFPFLWLWFFWNQLPLGSGPIIPMMVTFWVVQLGFLFARSVRVVLTAQVLRLGASEFRMSEIRAVHVELPGWLSRRGARAKVTVETRFGRQAAIAMPNALGPFLRALQESGVQVVRTGGLW